MLKCVQKVTKDLQISLNIADKIREYFLGGFMLLLCIKGRKCYEMRRKQAFMIRTLMLPSWLLYQLRLSYFSSFLKFFLIVPEMLCSSFDPISVVTL